MGLRHCLLTVLATVSCAACGAAGSASPAPRGLDHGSAPVHRAIAPRVHASGFRDAVAPPPLVTRGPDHATILRSLLEYSNWIAEHHVDPALVRLVAAPGSPWESVLGHTIAELRHRREHYGETYDGPSTLTLVSTLPDVVSARYRQPITRETWLDARGTVVREYRPESPTTTYVVVMVLVSGGEWRLLSVDAR
jgi:hypothetical protein